VQLTQDQSVEDPDQGSENPSQLQKEKKRKDKFDVLRSKCKGERDGFGDVNSLHA